MTMDKQRKTVFAIDLVPEDDNNLTVAIKALQKAEKTERLAIIHGIFEYLSNADPANDDTASSILKGALKFLVEQIPLQEIVNLYRINNKDKYETPETDTAPAFPILLKKGGLRS